MCLALKTILNFIQKTTSLRAKHMVGLSFEDVLLITCTKAKLSVWKMIRLLLRKDPQIAMAATIGYNSNVKILKLCHLRGQEPKKPPRPKDSTKTRRTCRVCIQV